MAEANQHDLTLFAADGAASALDHPIQMFLVQYASPQTINRAQRSGAWKFISSNLKLMSNLTIPHSTYK